VGEKRREGPESDGELSLSRIESYDLKGKETESQELAMPDFAVQISLKHFPDRGLMQRIT
jgi:hypothetical protein